MVFPFEKDAEQGAPMPDGLSLPDQLAYQFLANLYDRMRRGTIARDQAIMDKGKMCYELGRAKSGLDSYEKMGSYWSGLRKRVEIAQISYKKNRTLENADRLSAALDGMERVT